MAPVAIAFAILELTGSASALGLVLAARMVPQVLFLLVGGVIADRLPRHQVLIGSSIVAGVSQGMVGLLLVSGAAELWQIVVLEAVNGAAFALFYPADTSVVPVTVPADRLREANALLRIGANLALIGGAGLAGLLVAAFNPGWTVLIDSATFLVGAALIAGMRGIKAAAEASNSFVRDLAEGWTEFIAHRWLWTIVVQFSIVLIGFFGGFVVLGPVIAEREMNGAPSWALIVGAQSAGLLLGGLIALRIRVSRPMLVATFMVLPNALPLVLMATGSPVGVIALAALGQGIGMELFGVYWYTALHEHVAPESLSRVSSYDALGSLALSPLGLVAAGPLADWIGLHATLWLAAAIIVIPTLLVLLVPEVRQLRSKHGPTGGSPTPAAEHSTGEFLAARPTDGA